MLGRPPSARSGKSPGGPGSHGGAGAGAPQPGPNPKRFKDGGGGGGGDEDDEWDDRFEDDDDDAEDVYEDYDEDEGESSRAVAETALNGLEDETKKWPRAPLGGLDTAVDDLVFQKIDLDYYTHNHPIEGPTPIVRLFGVTESGNSVCCHVKNFTPYFYIPAHPLFDAAAPNAVSDLKSFKDDLNKRVVDATSRGQKDGVDMSKRVPVLRIEVVMRKTILGFHVRQTPFFKLFTQTPNEVPKCRQLLETGAALGRFPFHAYQPYESNYPYVLRFMTDCKVTGGSWVTIPAGKYHRRTSGIQSTCQLEVEAGVESVQGHQPEGEWSKIGPLRILSFDIECAGRRGAFPDADIDPVIQIANYVYVQGDPKPLFSNVFCLNSCAPIVGSQVLCFDTEVKMLRAWREFLTQVDPDVLTGYNIVNFDIPYLINRAQHLNMPDFPYLGRLSRTETRVRSKTFNTKQTGKRDSKEINTDGRIQFDMYQVIFKDYKLTQYTLNAVSAHFLKEQKEDVHHSIITDLFKGTSETRHRLAVYCIKDAYLPIRLMNKLMSLVNYTEMARVTGVPLSYLLTRGQQIKVLAQLYHYAGEEGLLIPAIKSERSDDKFEGAIVIDPLRGFYDEPISTLDFSSLYPSIMQAHNLCYSTLVAPGDVKQFPDPAMLDKTPTGAFFVKKEVYHGLLPRILENLLAARRRAKADLKKETDPFKKAVLDGRQLALKISANSVYGFTGATAGRLPCLQISSSVTAYGREMIEETKRLVQERYTKAAGYPADAQVVYGDTDSVMVKFGVSTVAEAMELGKEAAKYVTGHFIKPINLEFEKVYFPYLLINKKRYAGMFYTNPDKPDKMDTKGIETVRRDNCALVRRLLETLLKLILEKRDVEAAKIFAKRTISDLLQNRVDLSLLVITKQISRSDEDYKNVQAHIELARRMRKRDAGSAPVIGDRVPYVIIKGPKGARAFEKSEDPIFVLENNIPIDTQYYLDQQIAKPLMRIFDPIMLHEAHPENLLAGDHTRKISVPTPTSGGLMRFAVTVPKCLLCKTMLAKTDGAVCAKCLPREAEALMSATQKVSRNERLFARLWTQCQRCQGSFTNEVLCTNRDCPIYYMRVKIKKSLADSEATLQRFAVEGLEW